MKTIAVKVKFKIGTNKTKTVKAVIEHPRADELSFIETVDEVYKNNDPSLSKMWGIGCVVAIEQMTF